MIVFATSDKGGAGRSVTGANLVYRRALQGGDVAYLDFDFGSPTAGAIFELDAALRGTATGRGMHSFLAGNVPEPERIDVWSNSDRQSLRGSPDGAGRLALFPGDQGGGEFGSTDDIVRRCVRLFLRVEEEFGVTVVDLSAGRSYAMEIVLRATAMIELRTVTLRWLVFHRWTRQHIIAAHGLVHGRSGILSTGVARGHIRDELQQSLRYVATAVIDPDSDELAGLRAEQVAWLRESDHDLHRLANDLQIGRSTMLGRVPLDPVLQMREQLITDFDVLTRQNANLATVDAFELLARAIDDDYSWIGL